MCGIVGLARLGPASADPAAHLDGMIDRLAHRGPDDRGRWAEEDGSVALGFRRLAILDPSRNGAQPMHSPDGRFALVFNGEIYNHASVRRSLEAQDTIAWRGHSDSEVLLAALARWGVAETLERVDGMFAFAAYDRAERRLTLARDPFGEKPLSYGTRAGLFAFASELTALERLPGAALDLDRDAVAQFLTHRYVPAPHSILAGFRKLPAGCSLTLDLTDPAAVHETEPRSFWSPSDRAARARATPFRGGEDEALEALDHLLAATVRERLVADVPVGTFLSGGIDSSLISALAAREKPDIASFTIGFDEAAYDEAPFAEEAARALGIAHTIRRMGLAEQLAAARALAEVYDEPFADPSALPTGMLCALARDRVTVALSGDGGDELFLGYDRYRLIPDQAAKGARRPAAARAAARLAARAFGRTLGARRARKLLRFAETDPLWLYRLRTTAWPEGPPLLDYRAPDIDAVFPDARARQEEMALSLSLIDCGHALPDGLQVKMDRASMRVGLEVRAPLLSRRVAEFAWTLPAELKQHPDGTSKYLLRRSLARHLPSNLIDRPKSGFEPPLADWLRGPLRGWSEDLMADRVLTEAIGLDTARIADAWRDHLRGRNRVGDLWPVLCLLAWADRRR